MLKIQEMLYLKEMIRDVVLKPVRSQIQLNRMMIVKKMEIKIKLIINKILKKKCFQNLGVLKIILNVKRKYTQNSV